ncbi:MAG: protein kinase [Gammaproteobacteria bacterium]|nr:protein kinase [Gammaproteobacteria bacterium]MBT8111581.1 protein kinase [Gammaproteobacteria bacterium]NND47841.1 protein kinase [Woeseiaceae bacterium]NNL46279.1 protein kinase [Woeseiaceae bacterium]
MSAESDKIRNTFGDQLASFDDQLQAAADDVEMIADIQEGIGGLLASNPGNEAEIRRVLQEFYEGGSLRKETFQLVKSMLDHFVTENVATSRTLGEAAADRTPTGPSILDEIEEQEGDDAFGTTTVIPNDVLAEASADACVQVGSLLRDRFLLQEKVSGGSMGVVYKALDRRLAEAEAPQPWVAIKVLSPQLAENVQALRALQQEATKGRCLVHPNIVRFIDLDRDDDLYFLVMEWLEGRTLASILDSADAKIIDHETAFRIVEQIGDALEYAHRCGIVHADVKPNNVMLMPNGDAKLFDFGVARVRQKQSKPDFDPGVLGAVTPAYSSMQVLTGDEPVASDDVFSLACLLYRLLAGHRVFGPRNAAEASQEGMTPQRPQGVNDAQWRALKKALSYARVMRFASVGEFLEALRENSDDTASMDALQVVETTEDGGNGRWMAIVVVVLALLAGAGYKLGYLDPWLNRAADISDDHVASEPLAPVVPPADEAEDAAFEDETLQAMTDETSAAIERREAASPAEPPRQPLIDFSKLPRADIEVPFELGALAATNFNTRLREDGRPVIVDFVRSSGLGAPLILKLEEVGFSGNRSPWGSGQYAFSDSGIVRFAVGQDRSRITLSMASDSVREADQLSTLRLREVDSAQSELAAIYVTLEDDDQRAFEAQLPANTIAFAAAEASIRESDPAVQIELIRFNPDDTRVVAGYTVTDVTATEGEDYFAPGDYSVTFGPGQRSARILIPLVKDALLEGEETFIIRLALPYEVAVNNVFQHIVVMIRDDEPQSL